MSNPGEAAPTHGNLFVGNVPMAMSDQDLNDKFSPFGTISSCKVLRDFATKQSKGCGFVLFASPQEALKARDGVNAEGELSVKFADNNKGEGKGGKDKGGFKGGQQAGAANANLYIKNVPKNLDQRDLDALFTEKGFTVVRSKIQFGGEQHETNASMVELSSAEDAAKAIETMHGVENHAIGATLDITFKFDKFAMQKGGDAWQGGGKGNAWQGTAGKGQSAAEAYGEAQKQDNLYVTGLPKDIDIDNLHELFTKHGYTVNRSRIMAGSGSQPGGVAMVQLSSEEEAADAITKLNGITPAGCQDALSVSYKFANTNKGDGKGKDKGKGKMAYTGPVTCGGAMTVKFAGADETPGENLFISGLPSPQVNINLLNEVFGALDLKVVRSKVMPDSRGVGFSQAMVQVESREQAETAIAMLNGEVFPADEQELAAGQNTLTVKYQGYGGEPSANLYISGLPSPQCTIASLNSVFDALGFTVARSKVVPDTRQAGTSAAMVQLGSMEEAASAIETLNDQIVEGLQAEAAGAGWEAPGKGGKGGKGGWEAPAKGGWQAQGDSFGGAEAEPAAGKGKGSIAERMASFQQAPPSMDGGKGKHNPSNGKGGQSAGLIVKYAGDGQPSDNLYITGLPGNEIEQDVLKSIFSMVQLEVVRAKVLADKWGVGTCAAMVQLASPQQAAQAIEILNGQNLSAADLYPEQAAQAAPQAAPQGVKRVALDWSSAPAAQVAKQAGGAAPLTVRYAGKATGPDGKPAPSEYVTISGFTGDLPSEGDMKEILKSINVSMKRMRTMKNQLMVQCASIDEATATIRDLNGWPLPEIDMPWPEA